jgi:hypothetical protein
MEAWLSPTMVTLNAAKTAFGQSAGDQHIAPLKCVTLQLVNLLRLAGQIIHVSRGALHPECQCHCMNAAFQSHVTGMAIRMKLIQKLRQRDLGTLRTGVNILPRQIGDQFCVRVFRLNMSALLDSRRKCIGPVAG